MSGVERIRAERQRQIDAEGWTPEHDDTHQKGQLAAAASCYAKVASRPREITDRVIGPLRRKGFDVEWPWAIEWWKPSTDPIRNLEKAGALIAAEIDRLERISSRGAS